jgi:DNA polymerase-3 subunit beta
MTATMTRTKRARSSGICLSTSDVRTALACVLQAVPARSPKPILQNVLLADGMLTGTDLDVTIQTPLMYEGEPLLLPAARLQAILSAATGDEVTFSADGTTCTIQAGNGTWRLPTEDAKEFPTPPATIAGLTAVGRLPCDQFRSLVGAVRFATDQNSSRYALGAVLVEYADGEMLFVGTDGRRMCVSSTPIDEDLDASKTLVPRRVIDIAYRLASGDDLIQLERTESLVVATIGGTVVTARQIDGRYPPWRDCEPTRESIKPWLVQVGPLLHACEMASICASEESKGVTWSFSPDGIFMQARSSQFGESSATCEIVEAGDVCSVKLDPQFAIEWLRQLDAAETVEIEAQDEQSAVIFRAGEPTDGKHPLRNVVMPLAKD